MVWNGKSNREDQSFANRWSRRDTLRGGIGFGAMALLGLLSKDKLLYGATGQPIATGGTNFAPTAKQVVFLFMGGGPSQVDTFDPKPELSKLNGGDVPESIAKNVPRIKRGGSLRNLMASPFKFDRYGECGTEVSELFPHTAKLVDNLCVIRSMHHRNPVHGPGECVMLTGTGVGDRPSLGSWITYGLGSENDNLPWFVVMNSKTDAMQFAQAPGWEAGFLPPSYQGTVIDANDGIRSISMPPSYDNASRRRQLDLLNRLNREEFDRLGGISELDARIRSYELAFRMQSSAPEIFDLTKETAETHQLYGTDAKATSAMGKSCLIARRLVEAGVRFVQIRYGGWDAHNNLQTNHQTQAEETDRPVAAFLTDLKRRGLLEDTLVIWGGEFGRTPTMEGRKQGRDHSPSAFSYWLAGGGVKGGQIIGATDAIGYTPIDSPVRPSDFHATMLHALGIDQHELYYHHHGRKELVTVLGGDVVQRVFS
jgi:hypothetical protein